MSKLILLAIQALVVVQMQRKALLSSLGHRRLQVMHLYYVVGLRPFCIPCSASISVDFITGVPSSKQSGVLTIMVIIDRLFKGVIFKPMTGTTLEETAKALF